jgi:adenylate kinase family enzyme
MERIAIVGPGGSGKSTLAIRLGEITGLPVVHLDVEYWGPGWTPMDPVEWSRTVDRLAAGERWIIDGDFIDTLPARLARADLVVFLDFPRWRCLWRVIRRRAVYRPGTRPDMAPGCDETLDLGFVRWIWRYRRHTRPRVLALLEGAGTGTSVEVLSTPAAVSRFIARVEAARA